MRPDDKEVEEMEDMFSISESRVSLHSYGMQHVALFRRHRRADNRFLAPLQLSSSLPVEENNTVTAVLQQIQAQRTAEPIKSMVRASW